ncbi:hypothetical protein [Maridesulfovibrio ferrireducens]|uniref:Uncharacterized protein n=1 Tax=Maridesulfovibrio ferrireducens TaxID=246191 RepID=A0A1G9D753_9BACT|nr:hypothetical protein [Maridesulfovibrio ferrireducens]MBI9111723.1 hypothetical protein [Maridesulfovibrio ferrireducens]SDK59535.1 hypothetical protein SAMN05660337_0931 [Maridesulfovibrio ferrireducens]
MIIFLVLSGGFMILALIINNMITTWHADRLKAFKIEEVNLRNRLDGAIDRQRSVLIELRNIKSEIINYENMIESQYMDEGFD